jgi:hypothetical protein
MSRTRSGDNGIEVEEIVVEGIVVEDEALIIDPDALNRYREFCPQQRDDVV